MALTSPYAATIQGAPVGGKRWSRGARQPISCPQLDPSYKKLVSRSNDILSDRSIEVGIGGAGSLPGVAAPLRTIASAVGYSRVHTRVHYPGDVIVRSLIGTTVGESVALLVRRQARRHRAVRVGRPAAGADARTAYPGSSPISVAFPS